MIIRNVKALLFCSLLTLMSMICSLESFADNSKLAGDDPTGRTANEFYNAKNPFKDYKGNFTWYAWGRCAENEWKPNTSHRAMFWYKEVTNGGGKGLNPVVGSVMVIDKDDWSSVGHVAFVTEVVNENEWVVEEYNTKYKFKWYKQRMLRCKSALNIDPPSASNFDPPLAVILTSYFWS